MKTNKSYTKRLKRTATGKLLGRKPGGSHFNAKQPRTRQLAGKKKIEFKIDAKSKSRMIP